MFVDETKHELCKALGTVVTILTGLATLATVIVAITGVATGAIR
jgi:hypothetical protein